MEKIKILVACHKPAEVLQDDVYTPIHVGKAVSKYKDEMADMIGDDTGDNISDKNPMYCELTAHYWAWKNLHDVEYIGFCHYRRFFNYKFTPDNTDVLKNKDMMVLKYRMPMPMYWELIRFMGLEDFTILLMVLKKKYPEYEQAMIKYLCGNVLYPKNMFVCKKELFDKYAEWLFDILFECEKHMKLSPYTRGKRSLAYAGEFLLTVFIMHHQLKIKRTTEDLAQIKKGRLADFLRTVADHIWNVAFFLKRNPTVRPKTLKWFYMEPVLVGFKNDHIEI